jgi:moderate conductance mechanosensitive channel
MHPCVIAAWGGWPAEDRFVGRVLGQLAIDTQEFVRRKLPHLVAVTLIGFVLSRL